MATLPLKDIPEDVNKYILKVQGDIKAKKGTQFSKISTVFQIIREHREIKERKN
jgi:hypothetical protein